MVADKNVINADKEQFQTLQEKTLLENNLNR